MDHSVPLDSRKQQILKAVVADYTRTGMPVGSAALAAHLASWSSATIRNELAMLSEVGYLIQPHTSAGRVPSDLGYRYYAHHLREKTGIVYRDAAYIAGDAASVAHGGPVTATRSCGAAVVEYQHVTPQF